MLFEKMMECSVNDHGF